MQGIIASCIQLQMFFLQTQTTWSQVYRHFRPKTGHMGLYQNCTCQDSSEFHVAFYYFSLICVSIRQFRHHIVSAPCLSPQAAVLFISCSPWCWKPERRTSVSLGDKRPLRAEHVQMLHSLRSISNVICCECPVVFCCQCMSKQKSVMTRGGERRKGGREANVAVCASILGLWAAAAGAAEAAALRRSGSRRELRASAWRRSSLHVEPR